MSGKSYMRYAYNHRRFASAGDLKAYICREELRLEPARCSWQISGGVFHIRCNTELVFTSPFYHSATYERTLTKEIDKR
jgi:hypothetical protein